jgi:hypothetical protein
MTHQPAMEEEGVGDLVARLGTPQPIVASLRPTATTEGLKAAIDRGLVHVKFTGTRGGTELGIRFDASASDFSGADFASGQGEIKLVGDLILDFVPVRFEGVIQIETLQGTGSVQQTGPEQWDV